MKVDLNDLFKIEKGLIESRVARHNRAQNFATLIYPILYGRKCEDWLGDEKHEELRNFYQQKMHKNKLFPEPVIVGFVASLDSVKTFKLQGIGGSLVSQIHKLIGFETELELTLFCFDQDLIYQQLGTSVVNTFRFYNVCIQGCISQQEEEAALWKEAANHMTIISYALENHFENNTIFQNIHLLAELTIKAVLKNQQIQYKYGHNLKILIKKLGSIPSIDLLKVSNLIKDFPSFSDDHYFSDSRYKGVDQKFNDLVGMAVSVQTFVGEIIKYTSYDPDSPIELAVIEK